MSSMRAKGMPSDGDRNPCSYVTNSCLLSSTPAAIASETGWIPSISIERQHDWRRRCRPFARPTPTASSYSDFAWAQAYSRFGSRYYPSCTVAFPFTPATGPDSGARGSRPNRTRQNGC